MQTIESSHVPYEKRWKNNREPAMLALTAGFVDTVGFVGLFGLFTNHVTGNLIVAGAAVAGGSHEIFSKLLAIPVFIFAVGLTSIYIFKNSHHKHKVLGNLFVIESLLLLSFMLVAVSSGPMLGPDAWNTTLAGMLGVAAMGMRITVARLLIDKMPHSTVMTGNVAQLTIDALTIYSKNKHNRESEEISAARRRINRVLPTVIAFVIGAALGSGGYILFKFYSLALPALMIFCLGLREYFHNKS